MEFPVPYGIAEVGPSPIAAFDLADGDSRTVRRTTSQAVRSIKAHRPRQRSAPEAAPDDAILST
jgi:hypothetical protein